MDIGRWFGRTPVHTFVLSPALVVAFELAWRDGKPNFVPWGCALLAWGYLQYLLVGRYPAAAGASTFHPTGSLRPGRIASPATRCTSAI
jgi:hypothetical protein